MGQHARKNKKLLPAGLQKTEENMNIKPQDNEDSSINLKYDFVKCGITSDSGKLVAPDECRVPEQKQESKAEIPSKLPCLRCKRDTEGEIFCGDCGLKRNINS